MLHNATGSDVIFNKLKTGLENNDVTITTEQIKTICRQIPNSNLKTQVKCVYDAMEALAMAPLLWAVKKQEGIHMELPRPVTDAMEMFGSSELISKRSNSSIQRKCHGHHCRFMEYHLHCFIRITYVVVSLLCGMLLSRCFVACSNPLFV